jgi:hypothetical protein
MAIEHFSASEFGDHYGLYPAQFIHYLDLFRARWGRPGWLNNRFGVTGALARFDGPDSESEHNVDYWGSCLAADVIPDGMTSRDEGDRALRLALECGFTGIGIYPHWNPEAGLHLGIRPTRPKGNPAQWSGIKVGGKQVYRSITEGLNALEDRYD